VLLCTKQENLSKSTQGVCGMKSIYSPKEAQQEYLEGVITLNRFYGLIRQGMIPHFRLGGKIFIRREALDGWIQEQERESVKQRECNHVVS
jgi:excisionase family DNA binding protein